MNTNESVPKDVLIVGRIRDLVSIAKLQEHLVFWGYKVDIVLGLYPAYEKIFSLTCPTIVLVKTVNLINAAERSVTGYQFIAKTMARGTRFPTLFITLSTDRSKLARMKSTLAGAIHHVVLEKDVSLLRITMLRTSELLGAITESDVDPLTRLPTRVVASKLLYCAIDALFHRKESGERRGVTVVHSIVYMFFDLDKFKSINDTYGHEVGDRTLTTVASILQREFRDSDIICRPGGDEFTGVFIDITEQVLLEKVKRIRNSVRAAKILINPDNPKQGYFNLGISIGYSTTTLQAIGKIMRRAPSEEGGYAQIEEKLRKGADKAMYVDKEKNRVSGT